MQRRPEDTGCVPLNEVDAFPLAYRKGAQAVISHLHASGESASEFFATVEKGPLLSRRLVFHLWHASAFEGADQIAAGNPGGRCRDVVYDLRQDAVVATSWWQ